MRSFVDRILLLALAFAAASIPESPVLSAGLEDPRTVYASAHGREDLLRRDLDAGPDVRDSRLLSRLRQVIRNYEQLARTYPTSGYSDDALWQAARLAEDTFWTFGEERDRSVALRLLETLRTKFPGSSLNQLAPSRHVRLKAASRAQPSIMPRGYVTGLSRLTSIRRERLPGHVRVTLDLEREAVFRDDMLRQPDRLQIDLQRTVVASALKNALFTLADDAVARVRVAQTNDQNARVTIDLRSGAGRHSVYALYAPYRVVIDVERHLQPPPAAQVAPPTTPAANVSGGFSVSRQLGLGVSRVVIDAGHGGHDPGAFVQNLTEADLVLDVARRLEALLVTRAGVDVVMTRRSDIYVSLEARTELANRADADLFLSIHANASSIAGARGVETYFLNLAKSPDAEAIAARENAGAAKTMHQLPDLVKAITLNNKMDESRDFATFVQAALSAGVLRYQEAQGVRHKASAR